MSSTPPRSYLVFSVEQADRITLIPNNQFPPAYKPIILSCVHAPKVAHMGHSQDLARDEPFSHEAREFVRKKIIGKKVIFLRDDHIEVMNRESGRLLLDDEDIGVSLACMGMCTIVQTKGLARYQELLSEAHDQAKKQGLGIHSEDAQKHVRRLLTHPPADPSGLFFDYKEKPLRVLVEKVLSGSSILCMIPEINQIIVLHFTGIFVASAKDPSKNSFGLKAKFHTEIYLLHRTVTIMLEDVLPQKQYLGSVVSGKNVFSEDLLRLGLAKISNSLNKTSYGDALISSEKKAQKLNIGVWEQEPKPGTEMGTLADDMQKSESRKEFDAQVIQIISGDTVILLRDKQTTKVTIVNVRANRTFHRAVAADGIETEVTYDYFAWEAREFLRKLVIGHTVEVKVEYVRSNPDTEDDVRVYATIKLKENGQNVGAMLVGMGLASVRVSVKSNSENIDLLRACEQKAKKAKLGFHNPTKISDKKIIELYKLSEKRAKHFHGTLQTEVSSSGSVRFAAFVDTILSPTHFRIFIQRLSIFMNFKISGIITHHETQDKNADLTADTAYMFTLQNIQGHDVDIEVESMDKYGNFVGNVFLNGENYAVGLVRKGLASLSKIFKNQYDDLLREAENLYLQSQEPSPVKDLDNIGSLHDDAFAHTSSVYLNHSQDLIPIMLTEIENCNLFYVCTLDSRTSRKRRQIDLLLDNYVDDKTHYYPKEDLEVVIACFSEDNRWYRATVAKVSDDEFDVRFIDYGNAERRTSANIRAMINDPVLKETPPLAREGRLAFVQQIPEQFSREAEFLFREYCSVPSLYARAEYVIDGIQYYSIFSKPEIESASEFLLREGFATIDQDLYELHSGTLRKNLQNLSAVELAAKADGNGIWQYRSPSAMSF